jgi:hypothetical protein
MIHAAFATRDFPSVTFAFAIHKMMVLHPTQHKTKPLNNKQFQPRAVGKTAIPDMHDASPPSAGATLQNLLHKGSAFCCKLA